MLDYTTIFDLFFQVITKQQINDMLVRLNILGSSDFQIFLVWLFAILVIDTILLIGIYKGLKWCIRLMVGRFEV